MKTVWVNRFNADGSVKLMSEWQQRAVHDTTTHIMLDTSRTYKYYLKGDNCIKKST